MAKQQGSIKERERVFTHYPKHYKVIFHNDDFTTMEFVVKVLIEVFFKSQSEANAIMLGVHEQGKMVVGIYSYDMAVSMTNKATAMAREAGFPLRITYEPE
ncbi:MAG: ATP-dependent Clp protease adaptor ClpS [Muribaculaceae bacterium]|nr:ATP-dependent Clp protease adaptor ClpS [Muribaculaceae bacterium]